jgi:hypothetical protein
VYCFFTALLFEVSLAHGCAHSQAWRHRMVAIEHMTSFLHAAETTSMAIV